jgi:hypothetical protein
MRAIQARNERFLRLRVDVCGRPDPVRGSCHHAFAQRSPCSVSSWCLRNHGKRQFVRPGKQGFRWWWRSGCAGGPTGRTTACHGAPGSTACHGTPGGAARHGPPCTTSGNGTTSGHGAAFRTGDPCRSAATAAGHGAASGAADRCTTAPSHAARGWASTRDPPPRRWTSPRCPAAASGHDEAFRATRRGAIASEPTARCGSKSIGAGTARNACATA